MVSMRTVPLIEFFGMPSSDSACTVCPPTLMHIKNEGKIDHLFGSPAFIATSGGPVLGEALQIDGLTMNVSDHFGWETVFQRK